MKRHLNTLFITTEDAWLAKEGESVVVRVDKETRLRVPLHNLGSITCFGRVQVTQPAIAKCAAAGVPIVLLGRTGRFLARITGPTSGNVLVRREQYRRADNPSATLGVSRNIVAAKVSNSRAVLLRYVRDHADLPGAQAVNEVVRRLNGTLHDLQTAADADQVRGAEGEAAKAYFDVFDHLITDQKDGFSFRGRTRRPPTDEVNALLSFLYALLTNDAAAACEGVGLDPAVGFLHRDRPGRPSLALDLVEEFRAFLGDRLVLSLINRRQVQPAGFTKTESGAVRMNDETRKTVLVAYQKRKQQTVTHPFLGEKLDIGLLVHIQARLLARHLRGELDAYPPFLWK